MTTITVVTKGATSAETAVNTARSISRPKTNKLQTRRLTLSDARLVVLWLNAAMQARKIASYERVNRIRKQLEELGSARAALREYWSDDQAWDLARQKLEEQRRLVMAGAKGQPVQFPGGRNDWNSASRRALINKMHSLHLEINERLQTYQFHPWVIYLMTSSAWGRFFQIICRAWSWFGNLYEVRGKLRRSIHVRCRQQFG